MNHKEILAVFIVGFCMIFAGSLLGSISTLMVSNASLDYSRDRVDREDFYDAIGLGNSLNWVEKLFQMFGGLLLSVFSAVGAFIIEDKYARVGLLLFSAVIASFILTRLVFTLGYVPTYYP